MDGRKRKDIARIELPQPPTSKKIKRDQQFFRQYLAKPDHFNCEDKEMVELLQNITPRY